MSLFNSFFNSFFNFLFKAPRPVKRIISIFSDLTFVGLAFWASMLVRLDTFEVFNEQKFWLLLFSLIPFVLIINVKLGLYRAVIRFISNKAAASICLAVLLSTFSLILLSFYLHFLIFDIHR